MKNRHRMMATLLATVMFLLCFVGCGPMLTDEADNTLSNELSNDGALEGDGDNEPLLDTDQVNEGGDDNDNATPNMLTEPNEAGGLNVVFDSASTNSNLTLATGKATSYKIVSFLTASAATSAINTFANNLKTKTGATFSVITDTSSIGGKQIVIGYSSKIKTYVGDFAFKSYTGGAAVVSGETVYISTASVDALPTVLEHFCAQVKLISGTTYGVASNLKTSADLCAISENLPLFTASGTSASASNKGTYDAGGGNYQQTYTGVNALNVRNYNSQLISAGYLLKQSNVINSNYFYTFVKGDTKVHINWLPTINQYSIIYGPKSDVPILNAPITNYQKLVTPSISQMALYNTGQSNVIQLEDGSFVVIDGGRLKGSSETNNHDAEILYNFLVSKKPSSHSKPKVIWMFTHAHSDHVNLARYNFLPTYKDKIELKYVCMNFPNFDVLENYVPSGGKWREGAEYSAFTTSINGVLTAIERNFPGTPIHTVHSGDILYLPGCEIEILSTHEDYYLNGFQYTNDTSISFMVKMSGRRFMVYGDTTERVNDHIYDRYGNYLKADIIQVTHHGVGGATLETFKANDPDICLWPVRESIFKNDSRAKTSVHMWIRNSTGDDGQRTRKHYNEDYTVTVSIPTMTVTAKRWYSGDISDSTREYLG